MALIGIWEYTMRNVLDKAEPEEKRVAEGHCTHYWIIASPDGPTSRGICKYCGAEKEFKNYVPYPNPKREDDMTTANHGSGKR